MIMVYDCNILKLVGYFLYEMKEVGNDVYSLFEGFLFIVVFTARGMYESI